MKTTFLLGLTMAALVVARMHGHAHNHLHTHDKKRHLEERNVIEDITVTVVECWLNGQAISEAECQQGIANGTLKWASDGSLQAGESSTSVSTVHATATSGSSPAATSKSSTPQSNSGSGVNTPFPDGQIDCSHFPSDYGAIAVNWIGLGGWSSVQLPGSHSGGGFSNIVGVTTTECKNDVCCIEGAYCSYACPPGSQKFQWPSEQGSTGQSVGGLLCKGGKLYKTNSDSGTLCGPGTDKVNVQVVNKLSQNVAICRTDYPGGEGMYIPLDSQPGSTLPLTCPDGANYYTWQGKLTSAQYYINPPGLPIDKACVWGSPGDNFGNWAPAVLGVGYSNGQAWVSIQPNTPTQMTATLPYTITLTGDNVSGGCRYQNGQYCTGSNYQTCSTNGCTVSAASGNIFYTLG